MKIYLRILCRCVQFIPKIRNDFRWLASTQLESVHARKVFPCFDEPQFKATFQITITRPADFEPSISNTPIVETIKNEING